MSTYKGAVRGALPEKSRKFVAPFPQKQSPAVLGGGLLDDLITSKPGPRNGKRAEIPILFEGSSFSYAMPKSDTEGQAIQAIDYRKQLYKNLTNNSSLKTKPV